MMVGLGEEISEVIQVMDDLREAKVDFLTIGQYLQPTKNHAEVAKYVTPEEFKYLERVARTKGFLMVSATPLTRSSYHADEDFQKLKRITNSVIQWLNWCCCMDTRTVIARKGEALTWQSHKASTAYFRKLDTSEFCMTRLCSRIFIRCAGSHLNSSCLNLSEIYCSTRVLRLLPPFSCLTHDNINLF